MGELQDFESKKNTVIAKDLMEVTKCLFTKMIDLVEFLESGGIFYLNDELVALMEIIFALLGCNVTFETEPQLRGLLHDYFTDRLDIDTVIALMKKV